LDQHHRVTQRGRFRLREAGPGRTIVTFRLAYHSDGGLLGVIADASPLATSAARSHKA
jgi:hypothetical protein